MCNRAGKKRAAKNKRLTECAKKRVNSGTNLVKWGKMDDFCLYGVILVKKDKRGGKKMELTLIFFC